ncbi:unnamed protein product [Auanema sp. JU1783]|nr:unnamed protein product [Auanema sp. JU1783]
MSLKKGPEDINNGIPQYAVPNTVKPTELTKYEQLLTIVEKLREDIKPTYAGNKICAERLKKNITLARLLIRENVAEVERDKQRATAEANQKYASQ